MKGKILVVDDKADMLALLERIITEATDHQVVTETNPVEALHRLRGGGFDLVITDLRMPKMDGIGLLEEIKKIDPQTVVVIMTAYATIDTAVEATRKGADDYITKPFQRERILLTVEKAMKLRQVIRENTVLREALAEKNGFANLVGTTPIMQDVFERLKQVAPTSATVLITGASGTGKELLARAIHHHSLRRANKLVTINCTAIPENVLESEMFGHVKGAFTGAWKDKKGLVEEADGGTLFLDEIGDLSPVFQTKLLRLLQEGEYKPVGGVVTHKADLRIIAATNHDLLADIAERRFREDLYYRLNVIYFKLPELKTRRADISLLAHHFLEKYATINAKPIHAIAPETMELLMNYDFPGNVRELENIIERGVIFCRGEALRPEDLHLGASPRAAAAQPADEPMPILYRDAKTRMTQQFHRRYIEMLLTRSRGNISRAAEKAGIQRQYLHRLMSEAGINSEEFKPREG